MATERAELVIVPIAKKLAGMLGVLLAVSAVVFILGTIFVPGDAATVIVGSQGATEAEYEDLREEMGLNDPIPLRYIRWLGGALTGDFGTSPITGRTVSSVIAQQLPVSLELTAIALLLSTVVGIPGGVFSAVRANSSTDYLIRGILLFAFSVPTFVTGVLLLMLGARFIPGLYTSFYTPIGQGLVENLRGMMLPALSIGIPMAATTMQMTRSTMLESLSEDYVTVARAKGASAFSINYIHALKNAFAPVLTLLGFQFGLLLGGLIVVEEIFSLPGLGRGLLAAIGQRDYPLLMALTMVIAASFVIVNGIVDLIYPVLDPRQRRS